jgi:hypothetical protein
MVDTRNSNISANGMVVYYDNGNICVGSNTTSNIISSNIVAISPHTWNFITINGNTYGNSNIYTYVNGILVGAASGSYNFSDANLFLGADTTGSNVSDGYMDELRLSLNINRYPLRPILNANGSVTSYAPYINIPVPYEPFPNNINLDPYYSIQYTPLLYQFESMNNNGPAAITFTSVNSQTLIRDLSWNTKSLQLVNYGANLIIDSSTLNTLETPLFSEILALTLNQAG